MATLDKRVQVLFPEKEWQELTYIAAEQKQSVGHLIREAVAQVYFTSAQNKQKKDRLAIIEKMANMNMPIDDWDVIEEELSNRYGECYE